jgi:hypothetical protein
LDADRGQCAAPIRTYVLLQRQFEDEDGGVCYVETHDPDRYAGHFRLRLIEFTPSHLAFEIDRPQDRLVEVTYRGRSNASLTSSSPERVVRGWRFGASGASIAWIFIRCLPLLAVVGA